MDTPSHGAGAPEYRQERFADDHATGATQRAERERIRLLEAVAQAADAQNDRALYAALAALNAAEPAAPS